MRIVQQGRFFHPAGAKSARRFLERNLLSIHGRAARLAAIAGHAGGTKKSGERDELSAEVQEALDTLGTASSEWLLLRDYDASSRHRDVLFVFEDGTPRIAIKIRDADAGGRSLKREAEVLLQLADALPEQIARTVPHVEEYRRTAKREMLALSMLQGKSLSILMQRSLRPRSAHRQHLINAGKWLGRLHASTKRGAFTATHGDFWPRNILFEGEAFPSGVVDWELGSIDGNPFDDVFTLPLLYATEAPSWHGERDRIAAFRLGFTVEGSLADALRAYFRTWSAETGTDIASLRLRFREYLHRQAAISNQESEGWQSKYPWPAMLEMLGQTYSCVFSG